MICEYRFQDINIIILPVQFLGTQLLQIGLLLLLLLLLFHPTDEQLGHVDIFFSNYYNLQSVCFEFEYKMALTSKTN